MNVTLFAFPGGSVVLPDESLVLVGRDDGGELRVLPPRPVWDRSELTAPELTMWSFLVAATGRAMLDVLPQLEGGCINYWDAGNWALNEMAPPAGPKTAVRHRPMILHLLGRSPRSADPAWRWGEAPRWPSYADRFAWAQGKEQLRPEECRLVIERATTLLRSQYGVAPDDLKPAGTPS